MRSQNNEIMHKYTKELENKNLMLTTFIDNAEAGMYVTDYYTGEILFANRKMIAMGGNRRNLNELIGQTCWKVMNPSIGARCSFCPYAKLLNDDGTPTTPYTWENFFPEWNIWLKIISQAIIWTDGRLAHMTTFYDITEMKNMQNQIAELARREEQWKMQQNLQVLLDSLPVPIRIVDVETTTIIYINNKFLEMFRYTSRDDLLGKNVTMLIPPISRSGVESKKISEQILLSKELQDIEIEYITATGELFEARLTNCIIELDGKTSSVGIIIDLSAEKTRNRLLMQAAEHERKANRLKSNFLSNMSHEIRTPMNAIIGLTDVELRKCPPKEYYNVFKKINSSAKNLLQIINDILDLSKIEADKIELLSEEFEIEEVLNSALLVVNPKLIGKEVELMLDLSPDIPRFLIGDRTRLWQILRNHLDNATKFTSKGSIVLTVSEEKDQSSPQVVSISFIITDTGSGMNKEQLDKVFLPYEQFYSDIRIRSIGTGLGLPISKRLCELMGGRMEVESELMKGTTMRFTIPFNRSRKRETVAQLKNCSTLSGLTILVIDDSEFMLYTTKRLLQNYGVECVIANSGEKALEVIRNCKEKSIYFDIVMIDYVMKDMNGLDLAKRIYNEVSGNSKLLIVTAYEYLINKNELVSCGICDVIEKPFTPSQFIHKITDVIGKYKDSVQKEDEPSLMFNGISILVFEDDEINQEVASAMLEHFGITTAFADNGREGIEMLNNGIDIDLIFMDLHMPIVDGYEATSLIRSYRKYDKIPIISLTADAMPETIEKCLGVGMNDFITKPIDFDHLQNVLKRWLKSKRV